MAVLRFVSFLVLACVVMSSDAHAQRYRYMDSSGNIHFVDHLSDVPQQYKTQIVPPTPTPVLTEQQKAELRQKQEEERKAYERKKKDVQRLRRELERDRSVQQTIQKAPASKPIPRGDHIEVIR